MAKQFTELTEDHTAFVAAQHIFFCGTAADVGRVNVSPKDNASLKILGPNRLIWRSLSGSGNETAAHLARLNRMTLMWCGFETRPLILRCYGSARTLHPRDGEFATLDGHFPPHDGARQIYDMAIDLVQTSCGWKVPFYDHRGPRDTLDIWTDNKGRDGIVTSWAEKNQTSIDGLPTHILKDPDD
ncbi:MAG: pyridoxamine 5'-phosphate oxidase family protein [Sulfitobacter sp.]